MRRPPLVAGLLAIVALAGCGSATQATRTVTVTTPAAPARTASSPVSTAKAHASHKASPTKSRLRRPSPTGAASAQFVNCDANIKVRVSTTTCSFAQNTFYEYWTSGGSGSIQVYSPAARRSFATTCTPGEGWVACTTTDGGVVRFTQASIDRYSDSQAASYASSHDTGPGTAPAPSYSPPPESSNGPNPSNEIPNYDNGTGYPVQCQDGMWSQSGGRPGACSYHGGVG
jgi:hypothetical protein